MHVVRCCNPQCHEDEPPLEYSLVACMQKLKWLPVIGGIICLDASIALPSDPSIMSAETFWLTSDSSGSSFPIPTGFRSVLRSLSTAVRIDRLLLV
ncbi:hypothetical protein ABKN59_000670 [Abortiporus biennis]